MSHFKIIHLVNFFSTSPNSPAGIAQATTALSMEAAAKHSKSEVKLVAVTFPDEISAAPPTFIASPTLKTIASNLQIFRKPKKLPLISEILNCPEVSKQTSDSDVIIYTNCDIAVMPFFYKFVEKMMFGYSDFDAMIINRRTIDSANSTSITEDNLLEYYAQPGKRHNGCDCFVLRRGLLKKFDLGKCFVGDRWFDRSIMLNIVAHSQQTCYKENAHLTFHLGDDQAWNVNDYEDQNRFTLKEIRSIIDRVEENEDNRRTIMLSEFAMEVDIQLGMIDETHHRKVGSEYNSMRSKTHSCRLKEQFSRFLHGHDLLPYPQPTIHFSNSNSLLDASRAITPDTNSIKDRLREILSVSPMGMIRKIRSVSQNWFSMKLERKLTDKTKSQKP